MSLLGILGRRFFFFCFFIAFSEAYGQGGHEQEGQSAARIHPSAGKKSYVKQFRAKIAPERIRSFTMPGDGVIANWIPAEGRIRKGTIIATVNEQELEVERKELEVKILKDKIAKKEELSKLEKQLEEIRFYASLTKEERQYASKAPKGDDQVVQSIKDKIELTRRELEIVEEKPRLDFSRKEEKYVLRMPFDGKLQYQFSFPRDDSTSLYLDASSVIATVCDDSAYYITLSISDPDLARLPAEFLTATLSLSDGSVLEGGFAFKRVEKNINSGGDLLAYFFKLDPRDHEKAHAMLGSNCVAKLYYQPEGEVFYLNKIKLASSPEGRFCSSWQELLQKVHPEYELILNAETELIVRKK